MLQTLFYIPAEMAGVPLFGNGVLLWLWLAWCVVYAVVRARQTGWDSELLGSLAFMIVVGGGVLFVAPRIMDYEASGRPLGIAIRGYGVMLLSGIVGGVGLALYRAPRMGVTAETVYSLALWLFVAGMIGARLFYVIEYWKHFQRDTLGETLGGMLNMTRGGLVVFGGLIGAIGALLVFARKYQLPLLRLADLCAPSMALGLALGRVGCFFNGCCFGDVCSLPWAVEFPASSPPHVRQIEQGRAFGFSLSEQASAGSATTVVATVDVDSPAARAGLTAGERVRRIDGRDVRSLEEARAALVAAALEGHVPVQFETDRGVRLVDLRPGLAKHSLAVHPTQIYSAIDGFLLTLLLLAFDPLKRHEGEVFALTLIVHAVSRFLLEVIRIDESAVFGTGLSISQNISLGMFAGGVLLWVYLERGPRRPSLAAAR
jgi:phosphatidylglycerol:prolipoprotein diacylglycerol transferase